MEEKLSYSGNEAMLAGRQAEVERDDVEGHDMYSHYVTGQRAAYYQQEMRDVARRERLLRERSKEDEVLVTREAKGVTALLGLLSTFFRTLTSPTA